MSYFSSPPCEHKTRIFDPHEATVTCGECSRVLSDAHFIHETLIKDDEEECSELFSAEPSVLLDWMENARLPRGLYDPALFYYRDMFNFLRREKSISTRVIKNEEIMAAALFIALNEALIPRTNCFLAHFTGVSEERMMNVIFQTRYANARSLIQSQLASTWIPVFSAELPLSYSQIGNIGRLADEIQGEYAFSPLTVFMSLVFLTLARNASGSSRRVLKRRLLELSNLTAATLNRGITRLSSDPRVTTFIATLA